MDVVKLAIPFRFASERARMTSRDIRFGLINELLDPQVVIDSSDELATEEPPGSDAETRDKWLFLVLAWLYEHRAEYADPLQSVEEVYADFGYPEGIAAFVRYMPIQGPDLGSRDQNERGLFERWNQYLSDVGPTIEELLSQTRVQPADVYLFVTR